MSFAENIKTDVSSYTKTVGEGLSYISWIAALSIAGRPQQSVSMFNGKPYLPLFGHAVVAVDMLGQKTWLPVLNGGDHAVQLKDIDSKTLSNSLQRCRAKAIAITMGFGLSLYADFMGDGKAFYDALAINQDSDLGKVTTLTKDMDMTENGDKVAYIDWASALAAAKLTDENFHWEVLFFDVIDTKFTKTKDPVSLPYLKIGDTYAVAVQVTYKGVSHTEILPIMGGIFFESKTDPDSFDWNTSVMRCLAKAIAVVSGYGLSVYAGEDLACLNQVESDDVYQLAEKPGTETPQDAQKPDLSAELKVVRELIVKTGSAEADLCGWLGINALEEADATSLKRAKLVLEKNIRQTQKAA